jgi:hypothetical protein
VPTAAENTTTVALAAAARRQQVQIRNAAVADIARLWRLLDFDRLDKTWQAWLAPVTDILTRRHQMSADAAALFYRAARQHATGDPGTVDLAKLADPPLQEWTSRALGYSAPGTYARQIEARVPPEQANKVALTQTLGTTSRIVLDGGRTTIQESVKADPVAVGFYRVTDGDPCAFCALMASRVVPKTNGDHRGRFYKTEGSAGGDANEKFTGDGLFKFHNDCGCSVIPAFSTDVELDPVAQEAARVYREDTKSPTMSDFRKAWSNRAR